MALGAYIIDFRFYTYHQTWGTVGYIYRLLSLREDLQRIIHWTTKKRLIGPRRLYQNRLEMVEMKLSRHTLRSPTLCYWIELVYTLLWFVRPPRRFYAKGSAAKYKKW